MATTDKMDRNLALEVVRVTEAAALAASRLMGRGDERAAAAAETSWTGRCEARHATEGRRDRRTRGAPARREADASPRTHEGRRRSLSDASPVRAERIAWGTGRMYRV